MLPASTGAVGVRPRHVALVLRRVAGHLRAVTRSCLVRFFTHSRLWEISLDTLPTGQARSRARPGRYHVVLGTLLHAPRLWEMALGTLPTSTGVLPGSPVLLPGRPRQASRVAQAVTRARLAHCNSDPHAVILLRLVANAGQVVSKASLVGSPWGFRERQSNCKTSPFNVLPPVSAQAAPNQSRLHLRVAGSVRDTRGCIAHASSPDDEVSAVAAHDRT